MKENKKSGFKGPVKWRMYSFLIIVFAAILYVGVYRVAYFKHFKGDEYESAAINNQINGGVDKTIAPARGNIYDRNMQPLALSTTVFKIILDVRILVQQDADVQQETLAKINEMLDIPISELEAYIAIGADGKPAKDTSYLKIAENIPYETGKAINDLGYSWLYGEEDTFRSYPQGQLAAQVVGFIRGDSSWGLESYYNDVMTGTEGRRFRTYEADNTITTQQENPIAGNSLVTTLDQTMQQYAEDACKSAYLEYNPENVSSIIMNPSTGEIYAMAQYPTFDCNNPMALTDLTDKNLSEQWDDMTDDEKYTLAMKAWKNFNITETFEPGSIYKPILVAMALEEGVITPESTFNCTGVKVVADYEVHCHETGGHGVLDVEGALENSCNVAMMEIITKLGRDKYFKYHRDFGYAEETGIDLPAENAANSSNLMYDLEDLNVTEMATSSFGQGFNATALQSINAMAAVINGGKLMKPYVVSQIIDEKGNVVSETTPTVVRQVISKETSDYVRKALESVVTPEGTGRKAVINGYAIGGKTGTAQQSPRSEQKYTLSFIAYLPVENPDVMVMTVIHKPEGYNDDGGDVSPAPMLREILVNIINYKAIAPTYDTDESDEIEVGENEVTLKDYSGQGVKSVIDELISLGLDYELIGSGDTVVKHFPSGNTNVEKGTKILINLSSDQNSQLAAVPDVVGLTAQQAQQTLEAAGFGCFVDDGSTYIDTSDEKEEETAQDDEDYEEDEDYDEDYEDDESDDSSQGVVASQMPEANVKIAEGATVKVKVSS